MNTQQLDNILSKFATEGTLETKVPKTNGNINKTFIVTYNLNGLKKNYLLQKINTNVFSEPHKLMQNINLVTKHISKKLENECDNFHQSLKVILTKDGQNLYEYIDENGEKQYYRMYNYIENSISYDNVKEPKIVESAGKGFGHFQKMLIDFPAEKIEETIPNFHNTLVRYRNFINDVKRDANNKAIEVSKEILFVLKREDDCALIVNKINKGEIPLHIIHNDTKVNNVMLDKTTGKFVTVIDLDTVMPGYVGYDYGDGVRSAGAMACEDEKDLTKVGLNMDLFKSYTNGYLSEISPYLTNDEINLLGKSIKVITLELGMRFLNDYINGDTYFKIDYPEHNLVRARNQFKLLEDIEQKEEEINAYITKVYKKHR